MILTQGIGAGAGNFMGRLTRRALLAGVSAGIGLYAGRTLHAPTSATGPVFPAEAQAEDGAILLNDSSE
jgi:hypothetical protein